MQLLPSRGCSARPNESGPGRTRQTPIKVPTSWWITEKGGQSSSRGGRVTPQFGNSCLTRIGRGIPDLASAAVRPTSIAEDWLARHTQAPPSAGLYRRGRGAGLGTQARTVQGRRRKSRSLIWLGRGLQILSGAARCPPPLVSAATPTPGWFGELRAMREAAAWSSKRWGPPVGHDGLLPSNFSVSVELLGVTLDYLWRPQFPLKSPRVSDPTHPGPRWARGPGCGPGRWAADDRAPASELDFSTCQRVWSGVPHLWPSVGVAQLVRAPGCGPGGRGFETPRSPQSRPLSSTDGAACGGGWV